MEKTSATLLERLRGEGHPEDWNRFVELYTPLLFTWANRLGLQQQDAADLVQDVFARLLEELPAFVYDQHQRFRGWLWTITRNLWITRHRRAAVAQDANTALARQRPEAANESPMEEEEFRNYVVGRAAQLIRDEFQEKTWQAFWHSVVEARPAKEVAAALGLSIPAVYTATSRVLKRLREEFAGLLD